MPETGIRLFHGTAHPQKVCLGFPSRKATGFPDGKPKSGGGDSSHGVLPKPPPKRMARGPLLTPRVQAPPWPLSLHHATADGGPLTTTSPTGRMLAKGGKRWVMRAWPKRALGTRTGVTAKQAPHRYSQAHDTFQ